MKRSYLLVFIFSFCAIVSLSFRPTLNPESYKSAYLKKLQTFKDHQKQLLELISHSDLKSTSDKNKISAQIAETRKHLKGMDIWFRYLEPVAYKKINGPLPVEWETEVFEKFEKPYKREGAGLTLAALHLDELESEKKSLIKLVEESLKATEIYKADSITQEFNSYHHFFLCNRLFLLNLAAIYTTGFECPDTSAVIPELNYMLADISETYQFFNAGFPATPLSQEYLDLFKNAIEFTKGQSLTYTHFDHFSFIKNYINPLFSLNQKFIKEYGVITKSNVDYSLNKNANSIFSKSLYRGQNPKGIFLRVTDEKVLTEIDKAGKLLFFDPILSGNNQRSCASCHKPTEFFTDTLSTTSLQFDHQTGLPRNTPSLINVGFNHLLMMDGKHITLQNQTKDVILNMTEMGGGIDEAAVLKRILSCKDYKKTFTGLLKHTPQEKEITMDHISSAITLFYSKFSNYYSDFDDAMNNKKPLNKQAVDGFNVFMSKAQCATCHFVPQFNGVKPPFVNSEFEVIGVPGHKDFSNLSKDKGRFGINEASETMNAFRTGSIRNATHTKPYMHNGVFGTLEEVIDFYDVGGGAGRGLKVENQTLSSDSLRLTKIEKDNLIAFIKSLDERVKFEEAPEKLPSSSIKTLNTRQIGGTY